MSDRPYFYPTDAHPETKVEDGQLYGVGPMMRILELKRQWDKLPAAERAAAIREWGDSHFNEWHDPD